VLDIQEDEVRAEQKKREDTYASAVTTGKLTQLQATELTAQAASVAAEKLKALETQKQAEAARRAHDLTDQSYRFQEENLRADEAAATSQHQRRELDLAILDIVYQQKLADLEYLKLQAERNGDLAQANLLQGQIDQLPNQRAADRAQTLRGTMDPLEAWLQQVPHDAEAVTEALQGIAVNGFDSIASSIAGVVTGTQSLGQAFSNVAKQIVGDIIQMTVRMLIFRAISSAISGGFNFGSEANFLNSQPAQVDVSGAVLPHLAGGGSFNVGGGGVDTHMLSIDGQGRAMVSGNEQVAVIPSNASAASPWGTGASGGALRGRSERLFRRSRS
jgi:hypothetical protein